MTAKPQRDYSVLANQVKQWGSELGFQKIGITDTNLQQDEIYLERWLAAEHHGQMHYMQQHGTKRSRPNELIPGTLRVISARMDYLPDTAMNYTSVLEDKSRALLSRYALGRDYHKVLRKRLQKLAAKIEAAIGDFGYRVFVDSAPVLEKALAQKAGLGWIGKHTNVLDRDAGSWFFIGELFTDLPLPVDQPVSNHCGSCQACLDICPTQAFVGPYQLDARRCISYLTIELRDAIPVEFRRAIGNRIYGCDDCQWVCPWNKFAQHSDETDFQPRHQLDSAQLLTLFNWTEADFRRYTEGSAIRRIGYQCWLRNLAIGLGNADYNEEILIALNKRLDSSSEMVKEHINWALQEQRLKQ